MSIGEIEAYRIEPFFGNQKNLYESRLGFSLDYYKYLNEFNIVKLTTSDGLEYFGIKSIIDVFVFLDGFDYEHFTNIGYIAEYFEQNRNDPQEIVDMYNAECGTNYSLFIRKHPREYQFIKDESLRRRCREFASGIFIPRCLIIHYATWVSNRFYLKIQQLVEKCESERIRKELDAKKSTIAELK